MLFSDYQDRAFRTMNNRAEGIHEGDERLSLSIAHASLGVGGEAGELCEAVKKFLFQGRGYEETRELVCDEIGDVLWYLTWLASFFGLTLDECAKANIEKLKQRYPEQFTPDGGVR